MVTDLSFLKFNSSAATDIKAVNDDTIVITRPNGVEYSYTCNDVESFVESFNQVVTSDESVGKFLDRSIKSDVLVEIQS